MSPIGTVVGVGFLLVFLRRSYLRKGRSVYVDTVSPWVSVQPNLRKIVQTLVNLKGDKNPGYDPGAVENSAYQTGEWTARLGNFAYQTWDAKVFTCF